MIGIVTGHYPHPVVERRKVLRHRFPIFVLIDGNRKLVVLFEYQRQIHIDEADARGEPSRECAKQLDATLRRHAQVQQVRLAGCDLPMVKAKHIRDEWHHRALLRHVQLPVPLRSLH